MIKNISPRLIFSGIAIFSLSLLAYAWMLQYGPERQQPCPLCVMQRYFYIFTGASALVGALHLHIAHAITTATFALTGAGFALWQVLKGSEMTSCQRDPIGIFINSLPTADLFPQYFFASGGCADKYLTLGLPVPIWSLLCFVFITLGCGVAMYRLRAINR